MTAAAASVGRSRRSRFKLGAIERRNLRWGLLFISPWLFGFLALGVFPILYTFFLSLTRYSGFREPVLIGTANYSRLVADHAQCVVGGVHRAAVALAGSWLGSSAARRRSGGRWRRHCRCCGSAAGCC